MAEYDAGWGGGPGRRIRGRPRDGSPHPPRSARTGAGGSSKARAGRELSRRSCPRQRWSKPRVLRQSGCRVGPRAACVRAPRPVSWLPVSPTRRHGVGCRCGSPMSATSRFDSCSVCRGQCGWMGRRCRDEEFRISNFEFSETLRRTIRVYRRYLKSQARSPEVPGTHIVDVLIVNVACLASSRGHAMKNEPPRRRKRAARNRVRRRTRIRIRMRTRDPN